VALAGKCEDSAVMNKPIYYSRCGHLVGKNLGPLFEGQIRGQRDAATLVSLRDELKE